MKKYLFLTLAFFFGMNISFSQSVEEKIESKKIAFITQRLDLSPSEAQSFWPIYNEYNDKLKAVRDQNRLEGNNFSDLTDQEADNLLTSILLKEQQELDLKNEYINKMKTVISTKKVAQLYLLERRFHEEIISRIKERASRRLGSRK